ncbi:MAG: hypothetical protein RR937_08985 [Ruthenibacterium sp.]
MRQQRIIAFFCVICLCLCGCTAQPRLGERAIVKAIYLDQTDNIITVALVVFTCASGTDLSSVSGQARIYTGSGNSVDDAIHAAEKEQNKHPFYAQNELLLLGDGAVQGAAAPLLSYFAQDDTMRQNLHVFYTPATLQELIDCEPHMSEIVRVCEGMIHKSADDSHAAQSIYALDENACGYLPILKLQNSETTPVQMDGLLLLQNGTAMTTLRDLPLQLTLLLSQQTNALTLHFTADECATTVVTQNLFLQKEIKNKTLVLKLCGRAERCTQNGRILEEEMQTHVLACVNEQLEQAFLQLNDSTFLQENDIFHFTWWLRQNDNVAVEQLLQDEKFYHPQRVQFISALRAQ